MCLCVCVVFQWSPFQLSGHCPHNRANRPVIWSDAPRRYFTAPCPRWPCVLISSVSFMKPSSSFLSPRFSLQCCRAVVPSQLSRTVLLLPTGLMEWSSKIRGEKVSTDLLVGLLKKGWVIPSWESEQPCDWSEYPSYGQSEVKPCVCLQHVPETLPAWCYVMTTLWDWVKKPNVYWESDACYWFIHKRWQIYTDRSQNAPNTKFQSCTVEILKTHFSDT